VGVLPKGVCVPNKDWLDNATVGKSAHGAKGALILGIGEDNPTPECRRTLVKLLKE
jgi:hypothetical protein